MVTLVTPAGTVNCCSPPVKLKVCEPGGTGVAVGVVVAVAVGEAVAVAVGVAVAVLVTVAVGAPGPVAVAVGAVVAVAVAVGTGDWAATGGGATIEWITGRSAAAMPSLRNARRGSRLRLAGTTTGAASKWTCSSWLSVSHTNSSASGTFSSAASVAAICWGLLCPSQSCYTRAAVGFSA